MYLGTIQLIDKSANISSIFLNVVLGYCIMTCFFVDIYGELVGWLPCRKRAACAVLRRGGPWPRAGGGGGGAGRGGAGGLAQLARALPVPPHAARSHPRMEPANIQTKQTI